MKLGMVAEPFPIFSGPLMAERTFTNRATTLAESSPLRLLLFVWMTGYLMLFLMFDVAKKHRYIKEAVYVIYG